MRSNRPSPTGLARRSRLAAGLLLGCLVALATIHSASAQPARSQAAPATSDRELLVLNKSKRTVNELYVSPSNADQWGDDRLGDDTIDPGKSYRARLGRTRECEFDVQVVYDDASHEENRKVNLCRIHQLAFDGANAVAAPAQTGAEHQITFVNRSARPIQQLFISPAESTQWGDDRLDDNSISVGDRATISYRGDCSADLRVIFDNKGAEERRGVDICTTSSILISPGWTTADTVPNANDLGGGTAAPTTPAPPPPPGGPSRNGPATGGPTPLLPAPQRTQLDPAKPAPTITVENHSGHTATELYVFPEGGGGSRGQDWLGMNTLSDGAQMTLPLEAGAGCKFAAHVVFDGHTPDADLTGLDLCHSPDIVLADH